MPRENKPRGRRAQAKDAATKRKHDEDEDPDPSQKRRKVELDETPWSEDDFGRDYAGTNKDEEHNADEERPFYGLLDDQEQEYFKKADNMLETNQFDNQDERVLFLDNVYKEAVGKELKLACSQSCSRLMERLIMLSSPQQLKHLFQSFNGHFLHLVQHRFASHCCETLFIKSAPVITSEMLKSPLEDATTMSEEPPFVSMENLFLYVLNELSGKLGYLMTERFASHTFRVLLRIFSGETLVTSETSKAGHRKGHSDDPIKAEKARELTLDQARTVPESFEMALRKMIEESLAGLDPHYLQTLATHPNGSPVLQQLVEHELKHHKKEAANDQNSVLRRLLPETSDLENTSSATFINGLLYDPVGSRLLESIIKNAPAKLFKAMWKDLFRERFGVLARNEVAGYVMSTTLQRLSREDLQVAHDAMLEQIPNLAQRGRTAIIRTLVERCKVRGLDTTKLRDAILSCWAEEDGKSFSVCSMLDIPTTVQEGSTESHRGSIKHHSSMPINKPTEDPDISTKAPIPNLRHSVSAPTQTSDTASVMHRSLLAQTMLSTPGPLSDMLFQSLSCLSSAVCLHLASTSILSPILQTSLTVPHATLIYRRKLITRFYSHLGALSIDPSGSHLVDAIWAGTHGMAFARERVAEELAENEKQLRDSSYGRKVWRNWKMDLYQRRRAQWVREMREQVGNDGFQSFPDGVADGSSRHSSTRPSSRGSARSRANSGASRAGSARSFEAGNGSSTEKSKSALDRARERHARKQQVGHQHQHQHSQQRGSGANADAMHPARQRRIEG